MTMFLLLALSLSTPTSAPQNTISRGAEDTIHACAPVDDFCDRLHRECSSADLSLSDCDAFEALCERDPCAACEATIERCEASGDTQCKYIEQHCAEGLAGCCGHDGPGDVIRGCAPASNMCDQLGDACVADGLEADDCAAFAGLCDEARHLTCDAARTVCEEAGGACNNIIEVCSENLIGCAPPACEFAGTMTSAEVVAFCFANPSRLEGCGALPSTGHCLSLMTWKECGITSCEWAECMADLEAQGNTCPVELPATCLKIHKCDLAEQSGLAARRGERPLVQWCGDISEVSDEMKAAICGKYPLGRADGCGVETSKEKCMAYFDQQAECGVTTCEYTACAHALQKAGCDESPPECIGISSCVF